MKLQFVCIIDVETGANDTGDIGGQIIIDTRRHYIGHIAWNQSNDRPRAMTQVLEAIRNQIEDEMRK